MSYNYAESLPGDVKQTLTFSEVEELIAQFKKLDKEGDGKVPRNSLPSLADSLGSKFGDTKSFLDAFGNVKDFLSFPDFVKAFSVVHSSKKVVKVKGSHEDTVHTISEDEKRGYVEYINSSLESDLFLKKILPVDPSTMDIFTAVSEGILLCKLLNKGAPGSIDEKLLTMNSPNPWQKLENHSQVLNASKKLGFNIVNISGEDLTKGVPHLVLGLMWQVIKKCLMAEVEAQLRKSKTDMDLPPEQILLRWFNSHLANANSDKFVNNWSSDLNDSEAYLILLGQLEPSIITPQAKQGALSLPDKLQRAEKVRDFADRLGCGKFVSPKEIVAGNPRLNLAFVATLFQKYPHMGPSALDAARTKAATLEEKLLQTEKELQTYKDDRESISAELRKLQNEFEAKAKQFDDVSRRLEDALQERDAMSKAKRELEEKMEAAELARKQLLKELEAMRLEKDDLLNQIKSALEEKEKWLREAEKLRRDLEESERLAKEQRDELNRQLTELNRQLEQERAERAQREKELNRQIEDLNRLYLQERAEKEARERELNEVKDELARVRQEAAVEKQRLEDLLGFEKEKNERLEQQFAQYKKESEERERALRDELNREKEDNAKLRERIKELEAQVADLQKKLSDEIARRKALEEELKETNDLLEETRLESDEEKTLLLQRIRDLEEELEQVQKVMGASLDLAGREKAEALARARKEKDDALSEAERERIAQMKKVQGLLSKVQRQGFLFKKEKGKLAGVSWKKRYFVLQDNFLSFYKDNKAFTKNEPMGVIYCEQCRVYELEPRKDMCPFQLDTGGQQYNIAASNVEDMKNWTKDIKEAKKKAVGVKVVSEDKVKK